MERFMDGKYNQLLDSVGLRVALNVTAFALWLGVTFALVKVGI